MKALISLFFLLGALAPGAVLAQAQTPSGAAKCGLSGADMDAFAALDYNAFNYGPDGWRKLVDKHCYYDAAASIVSWLTDHEDSLSPAELRTQHYQAARNFALAGRRAVALLQLRMARSNDPVAPGAMDWNAFVDAFAAWLKSDRPALNAALIRLEQQNPGTDGQKPNLAAAQRFVRCFARDYLAIEQDAACLPPSASENAP